MFTDVLPVRLMGIAFDQVRRLPQVLELCDGIRSILKKCVSGVELITFSKAT